LKSERIIQRHDLPLSQFWERLQTVTELTLHAQTRFNTGWNGRGKGTVLVERGGAATVTFYEKGFWQMAEDQGMAFSNVYRWSFNQNDGIISLEHLRLHQPVFLFNLMPIGSDRLISANPHRCKEDVYAAKVVWNRNSIHLSWNVLGPKKNEEIDCLYT
jgi:hypothetical protein